MNDAIVDSAGLTRAYGSGGSPEPGPLNSGGLIISQKYFLYTQNIYKKN